MALNLKSSGGGSVTVDVPSTASNYTATLPAGTGNVVVNGINGSVVSGTAVASISGTSIDFTGIPSWVKRITVMFNGVSTSGTSLIQIQFGSGSVTTTGYVASGGNWSSSVATTASTTGLIISASSTAADAYSGQYVFSLQSGNTWVGNGLFVDDANSQLRGGSGKVTISGTLDRVRITTVNGTDTFDAGSINILYE